jgi:hypothetical protein
MALRGRRVIDTHRLKDIGPVRNVDVRAEMQRRGFDSNDFRAVHYETYLEGGGSVTITVFEAEGGVYFGPHISSVNWR